MKRLVPETLGKSIFRRYQRKTHSSLLERRDARPGYANLTRPLVWHTARRGAESGLPFLRRRQRAVSREESPMEEAEIAQPPETIKQEHARRAESLDQTPKIQRKTGSVARRTAVELPKSQPPEQEAEAGKVETFSLRPELDKPAAAAAATPLVSPLPRAPEVKIGPSQAEAPGDSPAPTVIAKPIRPMPPEKHRVVPPAEHAQPAAPPIETTRPKKTAPGEKPVILREARPDAPTLISRKKGDEPALPQVKRKAEVEQPGRINSPNPAPTTKPLQKIEVKPQASENKPAPETTKIQKTATYPLAQPDFPAPRSIQRKPVKREQAPEKQALPKHPAKPADSIEKSPAPKPAFLENDETAASPAVVPASPRPNPQQEIPTPPGREAQYPSEAAPQNLPVKDRPSVSQTKAVQRSQAIPAETAKPARFETHELSEKHERSSLEAVKPQQASPARRIETPLGRPPESSSHLRPPEAELPTIVHARPSGSLPQPERKPELAFPQTSRLPVQSFIQRETEAPEPASSTLPEPAAAPLSSAPETSPAPASEAKGKEEGSAKALEEISHQVYQILQRRLRSEFERSHGTKL